MSQSDTLVCLAREMTALLNHDDERVASLAARFAAILVVHTEPKATYTLEQLKAMPPGARPPDGIKVRIYSKEHHCWWRANAAGYTADIVDAGVYTFADAWKRASHAGPEKGLEIEILP